MGRVAGEEIVVNQLLGSYSRLRLLVAGVIVKVLVEDWRMLPVHLWWAGTINLLLHLTSFDCVARVAPVESGRIEVVDNLSTNPGVVVIGHGRDV